MNEQIQQLYDRLQAGEQLTPEEMAMLRANYFTLPETQSFISGNNVGPWSSGFGSEPSDPTLPPLFEQAPLSDNERYRAYLNSVKAGRQTSDEEAAWAYDYHNNRMSDTPGAYMSGPNDIADFAPELNNTPPDIGDTLNMLGYKPKRKPEQTQNPWDFNMNQLPFMYPGGSDINTQLYSAGRGFGMEKGARGKNALIVGGLGAAALGTTRNLLAGIGYEKQQNYVRDWYQQRQRDLNYTPIDQTNDINNTGGYGRNGGLFRTYEAGGMMEQPMSPEQQMAPEQGQEQQQMIQQIQMAVADMLQQGAQPEQVMQELVQQGIPEEAAIQLIQDVMMQMQGQQQQGVPQEMMPEAPMQGLPPEAQQAPLMKLGGKKVGDPISFKYGGKMHKGKIKKIENGKIYI